MNIKRIIFKSIIKKSQRDTQNEKSDNDETGTNTIDYITTSQALQIAGRAGRYNTPYPEGLVTTFLKSDLYILSEIVRQPLAPLSKAGLHPTAEHIELFSFHLPKHSLKDLLDIFISLCKIDNSKYFLCNFEEIKYLAGLIEHIPLKLRDRYTFSCAPISERMTIVCSAFVKFVRSYSNNEPITTDEVCKIIGWPRAEPQKVDDLLELESIFDILDLYLWLGFRFSSMFPDIEMIKEMRTELNHIINKGLKKLVLRNSVTIGEANPLKINLRKLENIIISPPQQQQQQPQIKLHANRVIPYRNDDMLENTTFPKPIKTSTAKIQTQDSERIEILKFGQLIEGNISKITRKLENISMDSLQQQQQQPKRKTTIPRIPVLVGERLDKVFADEQQQLPLKQKPLVRMPFKLEEMLQEEQPKKVALVQIPFNIVEKTNSSNGQFSSSLLNLLSNKATVIQNENENKDSSSGSSIDEDSESGESSDEEIIIEERSNILPGGKRETFEICPAPNADRSMLRYALDLEILIKEVIRKNFVKEKSLARIIEEKKLVVKTSSKIK